MLVLDDSMNTVIDTERLIARATKNVGDIVSLAVKYEPSARALVVYDTDNELTQIITAAYRNVLKDAEFLNFNAHTKEEIIAAFDALSPSDLVVLIQSTDFRLNEFRIRIQLFERKLKVIDHLHLFRNSPDSWQTYINALAYDPLWFHTIGYTLKEKLESASTLRILSAESELICTGGFEIPKLNIGDYREMKNVGGTFPIGEVFTEARDLSKVNGSLLVYAYANSDYNTTMYEPFRIDIKDGIVVQWADNAPISFSEIIAQIQTNERAILREIGFGLNRAITREKYLKDITAFERILGLHFSLGEKHTVYKKQGITPDKTRYHVDIFPVVTEVYADETLIFANGKYMI